MRFGKRLGQAQVGEWCYLHYEELKDLIDDIVDDYNPGRQAEFVQAITDQATAVNTNLASIEEELHQHFQEAKASLAEDAASTALVGFMDELRRVREYVAWNYMAVLKIGKKYNKNLRGRAEHTDVDPLDILMGQYFYTSPVVAKLTTLTEEVLGACAHTRALVPKDSIKCSICLDTIQQPVVLPCTHRFCHKCLAAASQSSNACPACRKADPKALDPENFEIDAALDRLIANPEFIASLQSPPHDNPHAVARAAGDPEALGGGEDDHHAHDGLADLDSLLLFDALGNQSPAKSHRSVVLGDRALEVLVSPPRDKEGWQRSGLQGQPEFSSHYDVMLNIATTYMARDCSCSPRALFAHLCDNPMALSPLYHMQAPTFQGCEPLKPSLLVPQPLVFHSHLTRGLEGHTAEGVAISVVHTRLLNEDDMSSLVMFEYCYRTHKYEGPWLAVAAFVHHSPDNPAKTRVAVAMQLDLNVFFVEDKELHLRNMVEQIVQSVVLGQSSPQKRDQGHVNNPPAAKRPRTGPSPSFPSPSLPSPSLPSPSQSPCPVPPPHHPVAASNLAPSAFVALPAVGTSPSLQFLLGNGTKLGFDQKPKVRARADLTPKPPRDMGQIFDRFNRITWTEPLHDAFLEAIEELGINTARPKAIHKLMNVDSLTVEHIKSHLQMYRQAVKQACKTRCATGLSVQIVRGLSNQNLTPHLAALKGSAEQELCASLEQLVRTFNQNRQQPSAHAPVSQPGLLPHTLHPPPATPPQMPPAVWQPDPRTPLPMHVPPFVANAAAPVPTPLPVPLPPGQAPLGPGPAQGGDLSQILQLSMHVQSQLGALMVQVQHLHSMAASAGVSVPGFSLPLTLPVQFPQPPPPPPPQQQQHQQLGAGHVAAAPAPSCSVPPLANPSPGGPSPALNLDPFQPGCPPS